MKEGGEGEEVRQQVLRACAGEHLISCEGQGNNVNLRRRKCFHEKGLVRQDSIRLFGKDFNSPLQGGSGRRGAPGETNVLQASNQHDSVALLSYHTAQACLQLAKILPPKTRLAACSSPNEWVFLSDHIVGVDTLVFDWSLKTYHICPYSQTIVCFLAAAAPSTT